MLEHPYAMDPRLDNYIFCKPKGNKLMFRGFDVDGNWVDDVIDDFTPQLFIKSEKTCDAKSLFGHDLKRKVFDNMSDARQWMREMDGVVDIYNDIGFEYQFINQLPRKNPKTMADVKTIYYDIETEIESGLNPSESAERVIDPITVISTFDNVTNKVHIFTYKDYSTDAAHLDEYTEKYEVEKHLYSDEQDMLLGFVKYWSDINPHFVSGWNINSFDNVFIYNRICKVLSENVAKKLSPFGVINKRTIKGPFNKDTTTVEFVGVINFDYIKLYQTYTYHAMPGYKLDQVAEYELGAKKLHHSGGFKDFYTNHWDKFVAYNIRDSVLVVEIDKQTGLMDLAQSVSYICGANMADTFGTTKKLDILVFNVLSKEGLIIPPRQIDSKVEFPGGFVGTPKMGLKRAVGSFDLTSLYPSIIRESNISPETWVDPETLGPEFVELTMKANPESLMNNTLDTSILKGTPYCITAAGQLYDTSKPGVANKIMTEIFFGRKQAKKESQNAKKMVKMVERVLGGEKVGDPKFDEMSEDQLHSVRAKLNHIANVKNIEQGGLKVLLNSFFGAYGNFTFRYYSLDHARSITLNGQAAIQYIAKRINEFLGSKFGENDYIIYSDTDSVYLHLEPVLNKVGIDWESDYDRAKDFLLKLCDGVLQDKINEFYEEYAEYRNVPKNLMLMDREAVAVRGGFWVAKKKYALALDDNEGVPYPKDQPYFKIMGLEAIKAGKYTPFIRDALTDLIKTCILEDEQSVQTKVTSYKKQFMDLPMDEISSLTNVNNVSKWIGGAGELLSGTPIGVRALVNHNRYLDSIKDQLVERLVEGDKIYYVKLRKMNPTGMAVVGFNEWTGGLQNLDKWVDRVSLWEMNFLSPAKILVDAIGFEPEKKNKLF